MHGERILPGHAYIAPGGKQFYVGRSGANYVAVVDDGPPVNRHKPSVEVLFKSAASVVGRNAFGIMLTGMGADGATAMREMKDAGSYNYVQDAPPPMPYTPEQLATFKMIVANEDGVGILKFSKSVDSDTLDALFNSAPKNQKTKLKERCRALAKEANDLRIKSLTAIHEGILEKQLDSIEETLACLAPDEREMVWGSLTEIEQMQIQNMRELAA